MSGEIKKQIEYLISESNNLLEAFRKLFYSVPIQYDPFLEIGPFNLSDLPKIWDYDTGIDTNSYAGEPVPLHYRWFRLTNDQFLEQDELFKKYITWASSARNLIEKFSPEKLAVFDEKSETVRKWIEMSERLPSDDNAGIFLDLKEIS
ncbi:hypothetical protein EQO05_12645 [Methanosarcina sp. MSH10X1]|uniref:hypothetical protein n=1 Tax=Methanosarcina sp. MSH10X1 TaxID=2507075 RepID=UPI000FFC5513|nr:hypothetical protein [Methanosarcina sp. MSH10X1]RXA17272.1 hypothetical protein EQO05_12645 [Methanosarcina sp. MSH10X1]